MSESDFINISAMSYDQQRRLQAAEIIAFTIGGILVLFTVALTLYISRGHLGVGQATAAYMLDSVLIISIGLFAFGGFAAHRHVIGLAEGCTILAINLGTITFDILWVFPLGNGVDPIILVAFAVSGVIIGITGAVGKPWMVLATMALMNALTVGLVWLAPPSPQLGPIFAQERLLYLPLALLIQWAFAAIILTMDRIYQATVKDVSRAYEQARQLDDLKDQFITHINHELRTPIMALHGYVEYIQATLPELPQEELVESLARASGTGHKLVRLLTSILDVRRIDQNAPFDHEVVPVLATFSTALQMIDPREARPDEREIRIDIPDTLAIWGEPVRLQQILTNLVSNAIKYSPEGTPIDVSAKTVSEAQLVPAGRWGLQQLRQERAMVEIVVRDYGLGVPPEQIPVLFNRFARLPRDLASKVRGNGLGLYLCRAMAVAMNGHIWMESSGVAGEGSSLHLRLPLAQTVPQPATPVV